MRASAAAIFLRKEEFVIGKGVEGSGRDTAAECRGYIRGTFENRSDFRYWEWRNFEKISKRVHKP